VTADNPARRGAALRLYATGLGPLNGTATHHPLQVLVDEHAVTPQSVALVTELPGVYEVRLTLPADTAPSAQVKVQLLQAEQTSKAAYLPVE
jgi:uncharacterized protein (TIGR03437 family)